MAIVLLTDFGSADGYVGMMKGVISKIAPEVPLLDLAHDLPPYQVSHAAWVLAHALPYFPEESIFVAVVDPGVGTKRKPILVKTQNYTFIGPDNGIFSLALKDHPPLSIYHLVNEEYFLAQPSHTFHGRDIFASVAAHLSRGVDLAQLGKPIETLTTLENCVPKQIQGTWHGEIMAIDHFGNAITNFHQRDLSKKEARKVSELKIVGSRRRPLKKWVQFYGEGKLNEILLLFGASGYLEIAVREGSAADKLKLRIGQKLVLSE